jgi:hypothetical protein
VDITISLLFRLSREKLALLVRLCGRSDPHEREQPDKAANQVRNFRFQNPGQKLKRRRGCFNCLLPTAYCLLLSAYLFLG